MASVTSILTQQSNTSLEQPIQGQRKERGKVFQNYNKF